MIYPITIIGNPTLRKKAEEIDHNYPNLEEIIKNMWETMYASDGVGLAAPQINKPIRLIVIDSSPMTEENDKTASKLKKVLINPTILEFHGNPILFNEGCLSIPGIREDVSRAPKIKIKYYDTNFKEYIEDYDGIAARVIQHEYDHLEGVLFTDKLSAFRRGLIKNKLISISKGRFKTSYQTIPNKKA